MQGARLYVVIDGGHLKDMVKISQRMPTLHSFCLLLAGNEVWTMPTVPADVVQMLAEEILRVGGTGTIVARGDAAIFGYKNDRFSHYA